MSDSLRDQLMQAGFEEKTPATKSKTSRSGSRSGTRSGTHSGTHSGTASGPQSGARPDNRAEARSGATAGKDANGGRRNKRNSGKTTARDDTSTGAGRRATSRAQATGSSGTRHQQDAITAQQAAAIELRKANKAKIKTLIEANRVAEHAGESVYRFIQGSRIKQLFVNDTIRQQLIAGELVITRLNGTTHLVPPAIGEAILAINADWAMIHPGAASTATGTTDVDDEYADYQVPDDLQW